MTIAETREKCKSTVARIPRDYLVLTVLVLVSSASFWLGYLAGLDARSVNTATDEALSSSVIEEEGQFVASKNGTKYYPLGCAGADRISENNKVWFASAMAAIDAGYAPAANCK